MIFYDCGIRRQLFLQYLITIVPKGIDFKTFVFLYIFASLAYIPKNLQFQAILSLILVIQNIKLIYNNIS